MNDCPKWSHCEQPGRRRRHGHQSTARHDATYNVAYSVTLEPWSKRNVTASPTEQQVCQKPQQGPRKTFSQGQFKKSFFLNFAFYNSAFWCTSYFWVMTSPPNITGPRENFPLLNGLQNRVSYYSLWNNSAWSGVLNYQVSSITYDQEDHYRQQIWQKGNYDLRLTRELSMW